MSEAGTSEQLGDRYSLTHRLASGGMGTVWEGRDLNLDRPIAVKVLNPALTDDPRFIERFRQEARAAAGLIHPNVAGVFDYGEHEGTPYIVMELIHGETVADRVAREGPLPPKEVARVGAEVKSANVMLTERGAVKVLDFGIAAAEGGTGLTGTGKVMGTARYFSPEQAMGQPATPASDLYSLGVVLYELLTGAAPFDRETPLATAMAHVQQPPPPVLAARPEAPQPLAAVVERCLAKRPEDRPASATELAAALRGGDVEDRTAVLPLVPSPAANEGPGASSRKPRPGVAGTPGRRLIPILILAALIALMVGLAVAAGDDDDVRVPSVRGKQVDEAVQVLRRRGLQPDVIRRVSDEPDGVVIRQRPGAGSRVDVGGPVILVVAGGQSGEKPSPDSRPSASPKTTSAPGGDEEDEDD
jgi:serine/threonine-protein kinase